MWQFLLLSSHVLAKTRLCTGPDDTEDCVLEAGTGYGCDNACNFGDVNYVVEAQIRTYTVPGSAKLGLDGENDIALKVRTFEAGDGSSSMCEIDHKEDGKRGPLGPCMQVNPGQILNVKLVNNLVNGMQEFNQRAVTVKDYYDLVSDPTHAGLDSGVGNNWNGTVGKLEDLEKASMGQDIPGKEASFDVVNLHFHGMDVMPHLFHPLGTAAANAPWITTYPPGNGSTQNCYCYSLEVPKYHPQGLFWWHIHRHGSETMQAWQGMVGMLQVGSRNSTGSPLHDLDQQLGGKYDVLPITATELSYDESTKVVNAQGVSVFSEPNFLDANDFILGTNNAYQPTFNATQFRPVYIPFLNAHVITGLVVYFIDSNDKPVEFYLFASDGITYDRTYKRTMLFTGPGNREAFLVSFPTAGEYRMMSGPINDYQDNGEFAGLQSPTGPIGDNDVVLAFFNVAQGTDLPRKLSFNMTSGRTPQTSADSSEVDDKPTVVDFHVGTDLGTWNAPQFTLDNQLYDINSTEHYIDLGKTQIWELKSTSNYFHPFHIHVNPFVVTGVYTTNVTGDYLQSLVTQTTTLYDEFPKYVWHDVIMIPPYGRVYTKQEFGNKYTKHTGKTVFHCHFLDHADQGMMSNVIISTFDKSDL